jgi:Leucine-rich repeat (LRR) protein
LDLFKPAQPQSQRLLEFPPHQNLGRLYYSTARGYAFLDYAIGTISVPNGLSLVLRVDSHVSTLSPLSSIQPDAFDLLSLAHTNLSNDELRHLSNLTGLKALLLDYTRLTGQGLKWLQNITPYFLSSRMTLFSDEGMKLLPALSSLTCLDLSDSRITDLGMANLADLKHIDSLSLWENRISSKAALTLGSMKSLKTLCLGGTIFGDEGASCLQSLDLLTTLELPRTAITDKALGPLALIPNLAELGLSSNRISDGGIRALLKCRTLRKITLARTAVTDEAMFYLTELPALEELDLSSTELTDRCIPSICNMPSLKRITLHETKISPAAAERLQQQCPALTVSWMPLIRSAVPPQLAGTPLNLPNCAEPESVRAADSKNEPIGVSA